MFYSAVIALQLLNPFPHPLFIVHLLLKLYILEHPLSLAL
jgi:hypothetical protein